MFWTMYYDFIRLMKVELETEHRPLAMINGCLWFYKFYVMVCYLAPIALIR